jgi:hypothetical protein
MNDKGTCSEHLRHLTNRFVQPSHPKPAPAKALAPEAVSMGKLGAKVTRPGIGEFLDSLPDQELA